MSEFRVDRVIEAVSASVFGAPRPRPGLLFDSDIVPLARERAAAKNGLLAQLKRNADGLIEAPPEYPGISLEASGYDSTVHASEAQAAAEAFVLLQDPAYAEWTKRRIADLLQRPTWKYPAHDTCRFLDHCTANAAACIAIAHDYLGDFYSEEESAALAEGLRVKLLEPFVSATHDRFEWWSKPGLESNWKIMCFGESGLTLCGFASYWPESVEAIKTAVYGVAEILDMVPPEGDWPEGVGYWTVTLQMGLRFAAALKRLTDGRADLYQHPALRVTGDFPTMLTTPAGRVFHFADNSPFLRQESLEGILLLARENNRSDWLYCARQFQIESLLGLALDDPEIPAKPAQETICCFPRTGAAAMRSGWDKDDLFVGMICGPSDVGHGHLDSASFVLEAKGQPLIWEEDIWRYASPHGFFDMYGPRWNYDGCSTIGHNTILVDGCGQLYGAGLSGFINRVQQEDGWSVIEGDSTLPYGDRLFKFVRSLCMVGSDTVVVRDVIECRGPRRVEWLMHYKGSVRSEGDVSVIENEGVSLTCKSFLPKRGVGWRITDSNRTSHYLGNDVRRDETGIVRYRSFGTLQAFDRFEFLFGFKVDGRVDASDWRFTQSDDCWTLMANGERTIYPVGDSLGVR